MTRPKDKAEARMTRMKEADARMERPAKGAEVRTPRAQAGAELPSGQRVAASVRLRICANVFACSRIHFDASRWTPAASAANDVAPALVQPRAGTEGDGRRSATPHGDELTLH